mgnify:CR=1 FL=1
MIQKIFEIITKTDKAEKDLKKVSDGVEKVNDGLETTNKETKKLGLLGKGFAAAKKGASAFGVGLKTIASGAGIFTLIALGLDKLKELFQSNQRVVDAFNIAFEALSIAFNDFFNFVSDNVGTVTGFFKSLFSDPTTKIKEFGNAIYEGIVVRIKQGLEALGLFGKAIGKLFTGDFKGAIDTAKEATKELFDIVTGEEGGFEAVKETVQNAATAVTEYTKTTVAAATANIELKNSAELASVANQGLIEEFDRQAEAQRQIRDDVRLDIETRKKANDELLQILEKQKTAMLENADIAVKAAQAELAKDKENIEAKKALMEAENERKAVIATTTGFISEQKTNEAALEQELKELANSRLESENKISIERKRNNAEQIEDNIKRLEKLKEIDAQERDIELKRLQSVIDTANAGTQAKIDAEIAFNEAKLEFDRQALERAKELADAQVAANKEKNDKKEADDAIQDAKDKERAENERILNDQKVQGVMNTLETIANISALFAGESEKEQKKAFEIQKAVSIAQTLISTAQSAIDSYKSLSGIPVVGPALGFAASAAAVTAGLAQVKQIKDQKFNGGGSTSPSPVSSGGGGASTTQAPSFNVVGQSGFNQIAGALGEQPPAQAFVVAGDVTTAQELQNNTIQQATF